MKSQTERAIYRRLQRKLSKQELYLKKSTPELINDNGEYYVVNCHNSITAQHIDINDWAAQEGVL